MYISKIIIENYKCFKGKFTLKLNEHLNILVGDNEVGKSTIIEAINLALTGLLNGRYLKPELNQYLFNIEVVDEYLKSLKATEGETVPAPPQILIEVYIEGIQDDSLKALFEGNGNSMKQKACGIQFRISLNDTHKPYYEELVKSGDVQSLPIEFYDFHWSSFARDESTTPSAIPLKPAMIDSASSRYSNGSDIYISRILRDHLEDAEKNAVSQAHRKFRDFFDQDNSIKDINAKIKKAIDISDKDVRLSVDVSSKNAWETSLTTYLDKVPFHYVGKGEQTLVKTKLALGHKKAQEANVLLVEEPENHLSHTKLNKLIDFIKDSNSDKQIIVSTHSSFVANKLGLGNLILFSLDEKSKLRDSMPFNDLSGDTKEYFEKLSGYDTLRLILCRSAILVEGDSDELVVKKAYRLSHGDKLPIHEEKEVISVGTAFLRFLEIAEKLGKRVAVLTDSDGEIDFLEKKYGDYIGENEKSNIKICYDKQIDTGELKMGELEKPFNYNTLEPKLLKANSLKLLNKVLKKNFDDEDGLHKFMNANKTDVALEIFKTSERISFPQYILDAIEFIEDEKQ